MTGTSLDALDVALVEIHGRGLDLGARLHQTHHIPLPEDLRATLRRLAGGESAPPVTYLRAARALGELHAAAVAELLARTPALQPHPSPDLIVCHGQTIWHAPQERLSWQLFDPWPVTRRLGVPVLYDLRQADLVAGGQGAPITPLADWILFRDPQRTRLVVNLGGIVNVTHLPAGGTPATITGEDLGPCNLLLDGLVQRLFPPRTYDENGQLAGRGGASSLVYHLIKQAPFFRRTSPRSTGREDFSGAWIDQVRAEAGLPAHDLLASAGHAIARLIEDYAVAQVSAAPGDVVLAGGGVKNKALFLHIRDRLQAHGWRVQRSDELGVPVEAREALEFAVLGALSQDGVPLTLPQITGAQQPGVAGAWAGYEAKRLID